jgi:hypothetical protein
MANVYAYRRCEERMTAILIQINEITQRRKYESIREIANAKG